ncbi:NADPH-dependent F420 reductase [Sedimenticola selenatireducens]|uniref:NADPH-dependent F420 reductase n=1 Tax=Sedimenticola selenatireducens TaxID=191960 RepID=UPI00048B8B96
MKITVIGAGNMGAAFVKQLSLAGHQVTVTAREIAKAESIATAHPGVNAASPALAADQAEVVIVATPYEEAVNALQSVGDLQDKVVIDITNPLTPNYMGLTIGHETSAAEEIAKVLPGVNLVKAFNTVFAQVLAEGGDFGDGRKVTVFIAGDSDDGKDKARAVAESMGFATIDAGGLKNARYLEPLAGLNIYLGYGAGLGTHIAPTWMQDA